MQLQSEFKFKSVISYSFWELRPRPPPGALLLDIAVGFPSPRPPPRLGPNLDDGLTPLIVGLCQCQKTAFEHVL